MGFLKTVIIACLIIYLINKVFGMIIKFLAGGSTANQRSGNGNRSYNHTQSANYRQNGDVNIDYVPKNNSHKDVNDFKGGEYVDYEEVKE
ncbi:DUF4834 family protein [Fulvivirga maritima]|uniref:DUF4834 family protein n=1 Tax=Fulvivirga maritima TaxID=2904247 RepID=UPI001F38A19B|nr:DUF4834 family protein [Fulvivirga maritima]UII27827.1 DUF4834 family protein [Fulvivirga maritima]